MTSQGNGRLQDANSQLSMGVLELAPEGSGAPRLSAASFLKPAQARMKNDPVEHHKQ